MCAAGNPAHNARMLTALISFGVLVVSLFVATVFLEGMQIKGGIGSYVVVAIVFGVLNFFLGETFFRLIGFGTLGLGFLFSFITRLLATGIVLRIASTFAEKKLYVKDWRTAFLAALLMSFTTGACEMILG
jgi:uncharacterized membrane protein YvlD (DUF360 family)